MKQFLSNTVSPTEVRTREEHSRIVTSLRKQSKALIVAMTVFASSWFVTNYLAEELPVVDGLSSLLSGFAPLIGLSVLLLSIALLVSFLICAVERTLADDDDGIVPAPHLKSKWHRFAHFLPDQLSDRLSLKEHSPPAFRFS